MANEIFHSLPVEGNSQVLTLDEREQVSTDLEMFLASTFSQEEQANLHFSFSEIRRYKELFNGLEILYVENDESIDPLQIQLRYANCTRFHTSDREIALIRNILIPDTLSQSIVFRAGNVVDTNEIRQTFEFSDCRRGHFTNLILVLNPDQSCELRLSGCVTPASKEELVKFFRNYGIEIDLGMLLNDNEIEYRRGLFARLKQLVVFGD